MKVLGLNGSKRRYGNSELLLKKALMEAESKGAMIEQVDLAELDIRPCRGCMRCVFQDKPCPQEDDMWQLLEKIKTADGLILAAPTYILSPAGIIKMVLDRSLVMFKEVNELNKNRSAVTIGAAGLEEWDTFGQEFLNLFALAFQFELVGSFTAYAPGPGEALLNAENIKNVEKLGAAVVAREKIFGKQEGVNCPVCNSRLFEFIDSEGGIVCPVCDVKGLIKELNPLKVAFNADSIKNHRWIKENINKHYQEWILVSKDRFKQIYKDIEKVKKEQFELE